MPSRILIADSSLTIQRVVTLIFSERDFEVTGISSGLEARDRLNEIKPDIVLASVSLPGRNGYELCEDVKSNPGLRNVPVVLLVSGFEQYDQAEAFRVRADALLASPPEERAMLEIVRKLLSERKSLQTAPLTSSTLVDVERQKSGGPDETDGGDVPPASTLPLVSYEERPREAHAANAGEPADEASFFNRYIPTQMKSLEVVAAEHKADEGAAPIKAVKETPAEPVSHEGAALVVWSLVACLVLGIIAVFVFLPLRSKEAIPGAQPPQAEVASSRPANETGQDAGGESSEADVESEGEEDTETAQAPPASPPEASSDSLNNDPVIEDDDAPASNRDSDARRRGQPLAGRAVARTGPGRESGPRESAADRSRLLRRARLLEESGNLERAENQYRYILDRFPNEPEGRLGLRRVEARKFQARREETTRASRANREAGLSSFRSGNYADAATKLNQAVNAGLRDTPVLYALASSYLKLNRITEARAVFERCLAGNPNYAPALVGLARAHIAVGRKDQAVGLLRRALELGGGAEYSPGRIREMINNLNGNASSRTRQ